MYKAPRHLQLHKSFKKDGYDKKKVEQVYVVRYKSHTGRASLIECSKKMVAGSAGMYPPIVEEKAKFGSLSMSHHIQTLRMNKHGVVSSLTGASMSPDPNDTQWVAALNTIHAYVLKEDTPWAFKSMLSNYLNSKQDTAQATGEMTMLKMCQHAIKQIQAKSKSRTPSTCRFGEYGCQGFRVNCTCGICSRSNANLDPERRTDPNANPNSQPRSRQPQ